ncbi:hypothetical protein L6452_14328 [Arctium lappa]|uniref:Uncharacterized protein n=1 Tax=Arctium lappa TaxID=4217 RepID=A0ACB9CKR4_ARCLA|nr:hypothetical protein L6452_14328 [Arctium lappa]
MEVTKLERSILQIIASDDSTDPCSRLPDDFTKVKSISSIVTRASSGIGIEIARVLELRGVHVVMAVRNMSAGKEVNEAILKQNPTAKVDAMELDLSSIASIKNFESDFKSSGLPLNILSLALQTYIRALLEASSSEPTADDNVQAGLNSMDEIDQAIERSKQVVQQTVEVGTQIVVTLKGQTEQMGRIVNDLDAIHFSIKKVSKLVKEIGRQAHDSKYGLCDTYYIAHVKNACAFLGDGMSRIEGSYVLPRDFGEWGNGSVKRVVVMNAFRANCAAGKLFGIPLRGTHSHAFVSSHGWRLAPSSELIIYALIKVLDNVSDIDMLGFLPDFLDGLFNMLTDSSLEIWQKADSALSEFLHEIKNSQ